MGHKILKNMLNPCSRKGSYDKKRKDKNLGFHNCTIKKMPGEIPGWHKYKFISLPLLHQLETVECLM